jgi:hypothetical protein
MVSSKLKAKRCAMRKLLLGGIVALSLAASPAYADNWRYGRHHNGHHGHVSGDGLALGVGIVVGAIALGALLSPPPYYGPPVVAYRPAPAPYCVQDEVYRYLPDGRLQTGTRTTCY